MDYIEIDLTSSEILQGSLVGSMRQVENLKNGKRPTYGAGNSNDWQLHIEGALGEMAFAKFKDAYWSKGSIGDPDVGDDQVRTGAKHTHNLILHPYDQDDARYYLLTGVNGCYRIWGWILGKDGKNENYWSDPLNGRPAFFVPKEALMPVGDMFYNERQAIHGGSR